eukprot:Plantae.Rhodophyta-Hildenbrandia_rubra.ctg915.p1 GENE.Plantae.Rhodophyta-Hildenbrandia_rubra.ctg915~~Plantae.Rhodophyta-Hildenbrandia_rubra.ctg915.p1  ORF type:complete len:684 (+),score=153.30 Plantae.Rhodophyta-Hildenbrandia_rubra.ctg915:2023-4074(+)
MSNLATMADADDLDAELLAVTATQGKPDDSSDSEGLYAGEASSDSDQDADDRTPGSGDEDSDLYSADEDDDDEDMDYGAIGRKKKGKRKGRAAKKARAAAGSKRRRAPTNRKSTAGRKRVRLDLDDDDEDGEVFRHMYDREGYKDEEDRIKLLKMNELDRETLLSERIEERRKAEDLWNMKKSMERKERKKSARSSGRSKASKKTSALQAYKDNKTKKNKGIQRTTLDISDDEEDGFRTRNKQQRDEERDKNMDAKKRERMERRAMETKPFCYDDLVYSDGSTTPIYLRRELLQRLIQQPNGTRAITGLFIKMNVGNYRGEATYKLCQIVGTQQSRRYKIGKDYINKKLILKIGNEQHPFYAYMVSNKHPSREEFDSWHRRMREDGLDLMSRREVEELLNHAKKVIADKLGTTNEEVKAHIANMEILHPERVNWTQKKALIKAKIEQLGDEIIVAKQRESSKGYSQLDEDERMEVSTRPRSQDLREKLETLKADLAIAETNEAEYGRPRDRKSKTSVFANIAKKNQMLNDEAGSMAASRKLTAGRGKNDPFARLDTTGASYFAIGGTANGSTRGAAEKAEAEALKVEAKEQKSGKNWLTSLLPKLVYDGEPRAISSKPLIEEYGFKVTGLDIFDLSEQDLRKRFPLVPSPSPGIDAVYATAQQVPKPNGRIIDFATWRKMNQA